jgi:dTDP-4-dehydrorhamnose 3,5-epimerase
MRFEELKLSGAFLLHLQDRADDRGFFARTYCAREFAQHGLNPRVVQCNMSFNRRAGVVRGMHYQLPPAGEAKLVRCTRGAIHDVIIDLRPDSPTRFQHIGVELSAENRAALYVPEMFAHGFQALQDNTEVFYQVSEYYTPEAERGLRHDDPALGIRWPLPVSDISAKDAAWPLLETGVGR